MRDRLCDRLRDYLDKGNGEKSVIFSTHNIADMENAADHAVFMDSGRIIEQGFVEDLRERNIIAEPEKLSAVWERPTLQQLSVGLLKSAEERR